MHALKIAAPSPILPLGAIPSPLIKPAQRSDDHPIKRKQCSDKHDEAAKAATMSSMAVQSFSQRAPEVPQEKWDSLESPGPNRPYQTTAIKVKLSGTTARALHHRFSTSII
jgi:hypothetical protein